MCRIFGICFLLIFASMNLAHCQIPFPSSCPPVNVVEKFDVDRYMGTWYEYSKYPFVFEAGQKCQQAVYKNIGNDTISVVNTGVYVVINKPNSANGTAKVIAPGQLAVSFGDQVVETANYLVLDTDYDNWVVVYSCKNVTQFAHTKLLWILTRQRQPSEETIVTAKKVIKDNNLSETFLVKSTQTDCPNVTDDVTDVEQTAEASSSSTTAGDQSTLDLSATTTERIADTA